MNNLNKIYEKLKQHNPNLDDRLARQQAWVIRDRMVYENTAVSSSAAAGAGGAGGGSDVRRRAVSPTIEASTGYKVFYVVNDPPIEINDASTFLSTINTGTKWSIYLLTIDSSVTVTSIVVTPTITGLTIATTPLYIPYPGLDSIVNANWGTVGTRIFSVSVTTDSGNFSFNAEINVL